ncbi:hypothetical protein WR25_19817 [Diploscapter pachys]|uniref:Uncharacterized protein n=1 Tax=Diploscapter pachys TaxID=2018661 RepID=A0A2A2LAQ4_9BILA|nr:hypothetical protein WR25_19817 [Diploscapter pachys]
MKKKKKLKEKLVELRLEGGDILGRKSRRKTTCDEKAEREEEENRQKQKQAEDRKQKKSMQMQRSFDRQKQRSDDVTDQRNHRQIKSN